MKSNFATVIIQARMGSTRLPGKALLPINNVPIIDWIYRRLSLCSYLDEIIFAIPDTTKDDVLYDHLFLQGTKVYRGSENDVLTRFYEASKQSNSSCIIRICADNPFIDPESIDNLVKFFSDSELDYAYNHIPKGNLFPDGIGAEIITTKALKEINNQAKYKAEREHIFNYIWANPRLFSIGTFDPKKESLQRPDLRLDIDTKDDYEKYKDLIFEPEEEIIKIIEYIDRSQDD